MPPSDINVKGNFKETKDGVADVKVWSVTKKEISKYEDRKKRKYI